jgi:hypothetical protein
MGRRGRLWGAERIRGELLKLGIQVSKRTIQKYMRGVRGGHGGGQSWATFVKNHAERMWACDFIQPTTFGSGKSTRFFLVHVASWRVVHVAATHHPTQAWTAQHLRNATMEGDAPAVLLRDRDDKRKRGIRCDGDHRPHDGVSSAVSYRSAYAHARRRRRRARRRGDEIFVRRVTAGCTRGAASTAAAPHGLAWPMFHGDRVRTGWNASEPALASLVGGWDPVRR